MRTSWMGVVFFVWAVGASLGLFAESKIEAESKVETGTKVETGEARKPESGIVRKKKIEALLRSPSGLDFGDRKTVSGREVLEQLQTRHQLPVRFDVPTFTWYLGMEMLEAPEQEKVPVAVQGTPPGEAATVIATDAGKSPSVVVQTGSEVPAGSEVKKQVEAVPVEGQAVSSDAGNPVPGAVPPEKSAEISANGVPPEAIPPAPGVPAALPTPGSPPVAAPPPQQGHKGVLSPDQGLYQLIQAEFDVKGRQFQGASVGSVLRQVLESVTFVPDEMNGMPIALTHATQLDYIVEEDGIVITTRMQALTQKETRVYSVKKLKDCTPEQLEKIIRQTIRPYSWRAQFDDFGDKLKGVSLPTTAMTSVLQTALGMAEMEGVMVAAGESTAVVAPPVIGGPNIDLKPSEQEMKTAGNAIANLFVAFTHAGLLTMEMVHHGDPPTGSIETLPGRLVITQSQGAHREISELLEQLAEE